MSSNKICFALCVEKQKTRGSGLETDTFLIKGNSRTVESNSERECVSHVICELTRLWPELKIVHGKPRHSQSQSSVETANQDFENISVLG